MLQQNMAGRSGAVRLPRLFVATIPDDFDPEVDLTLGPWCYREKESCFPDWDQRTFPPDPFDTPAQLAKASRQTSDYANSLIPELCRRLNEINATSYGERFWRLMLMPWLLTLVQTTYERQTRIVQFVEQFGDTRLEVPLLPKHIKWEFRTYDDFLYRGILNPLYNEWLYSRIVESLHPTAWSISYKKFSKDVIDRKTDPEIPGKKGLMPLGLAEGAPMGEMGVWGRFKLRIRRRIEASLRCRSVAGISKKEALLWSTFLSVIPTGRRRPTYYERPATHESPINWAIELERLLESLLPKCYETIEVLAGERIKPKPGRIQLIGAVLYGSEKEKYKCAQLLEGGERLVTVQHGGNYGNAKSYPLVAEIEYGHDAFFSWGWKEHEDYGGNIQPLPAPFLTGFTDKHRQETEQLILVGTRALMFSRGLLSTPQAVGQIAHRQSKVSFLDDLEPEIFTSARYRPYHNSWGSLADREFFERRFPNLKYCDGDLHGEMLRCKLLVLDHPGTTLNIALVANIPLVGFWDREAWKMCRQAEPYFSALEAAGVLWPTGEHAAAQVNEIWSDVRSWWAQRDVQQAREEWCIQYASTSPAWRMEWIRSLLTIA